MLQLRLAMIRSAPQMFCGNRQRLALHDRTSRAPFLGEVFKVRFTAGAYCRQFDQSLH